MTMPIFVLPIGSRSGGPDRDRLITAAHTVLTNCGYPMGASKVGRLVRKFERDPGGRDFGGFIASHVVAAGKRRAVLADELRKVVSYADPTGETAVHHVLRGRR
jgi:hypothetical protein